MASPMFTVRTRLAVAALLSVFWIAHPAFGWVDKTYESDTVSLAIEHDGATVVTHDVLLALRGGPLPEFAFDPVDPDAELLPEATVTAAKSGVAAGYAIPLSATKDGTRVALRVLEGKGLRTGKFLIRFRYRTNLAAASKITPGAAMSRVVWTGLAFSNGLDAAKVIFRIPRGNLPPRLHLSDSAGDAAGDDADEESGVFLGTLRRENDVDQFEIVRPHVAKGESVTWTLLADRSVFELPGPTARGADAAPEAPPAPLARPPERGPSSAPWWIAALSALVYSAALAGKTRALSAGCVARRVLPRPLIPLPAFGRVLLAFVAALGAVLLVTIALAPVLAACALLVAMAAATELPPRLPVALRGPGKWVRLEDDVAFEPPAVSGSRWAKLVDAGTPLGFSLFVALLAGFVAAAVVAMRHGTFQGLAVALASASVFPLFFTGRRSDLPPDPARGPIPLLDYVAEALEENSELAATPFGRIPAGAESHDELRLLVVPKRAVQGLVAIEVGVEWRSGALGTIALPFVLVRVLDGSKASDVLPKGLLWTRGRSPDERVSVLRPRVPVRTATLALARDVARRFAAGKDHPRAQSRSSAARSSGKGDDTVNAGTTGSPAHAT